MRNGSESLTLFPELAVVFSLSDSSNKYYRHCDALIKKIIKNIPLADEEKSFFKIKSVPAGIKTAAIVSSITTNDPNTRDTQTEIMDDDNSAQFSNRIVFILMVSADQDKDFDVFSLKDFFLIWQKYLKTDFLHTGADKTRKNIDIILVIKGTNTALYHRISNLFAFAVKYDSRLYESIFYIGYHGSSVQRLVDKYDHKAQSVFPLIPIDRETRQKLDKPLCCHYESYDSLQKALEDPKDERVSLVDFILAAIHHVFDKDVRAKQEYENIKQLSLLQLILSSFYIQIQDYAADNIMDLLEVTDTQSNAIRQLIENIVFHSSYQVGVLLVRSYNTGRKEEGKHSHLSARYGGYFHNQREDRDAKKPYYEVCIEDASDQSIMDNFIEKLPSRLRYFAVSQDAITDLEHLAKKELKNLQGFFERNFNVQDSFWNRYVSIAKVAYHQGLLLFENNVKTADGYFEVISSSDKDSVFDPGHKYASVKAGEGMLSRDELPGTKIRALYPVQKRQKQYSQLINIKESLIIEPGSYCAIPIMLGEETSESAVVSQSDKERLGAELFDQLLGKIQDDMPSISDIISHGTTVVFDIILSSNDDSIREAVIKHFGALFTHQSLTGADGNSGKRFAYAIRFKKESDIVACVNTFKLIYLIYHDKLTMSLPAQEIFLYDEAGHFQILWYGNSFQSVLSVDKTRTFYYGSDSFLEAFLLDVTPGEEQLIPQLEDFLPFPVILEDAAHKTLFAKNLEYILTNDIMDGSKQGYMIRNTHMRLGSKIHITDFFQAEAIFQNSYFIKNFSYLIAKSIREKVPPDENARNLILLIGYGTYSELLMYSIKKILNPEKNEPAAYGCEYKIYDPTKDLKNDLSMFKDLNRGLLTAWSNHYESIYVFQIVPVNTTLTTFSKIFDAFYTPCAELEISNIKLINNYALIIIRDSIRDSDEPEPGRFETSREREYFNQPDEKKQMLVTSVSLMLPSDQKMYGYDDEYYHIDYFVSVKTLWYEPKLCEECYPENFIDETPLVETNKVSVIPALQYGERKLHGGHLRDDVYLEAYKAREKKLLQTFFSCKETSCASGTLFEAFLEYGHVVQNNNHFQFYFYTNKIFDQIHNGPQSQQFDAWLEKLRKSISGSETPKNICNIIISPLHSRNTGFLSEVSDKVFSDKAIILHTEVDKDFKDTFQSKYLFISNQISSTVNLAEYSREEYIFNFFYVDDTVYSGSAFFRAKSLANALIARSSFAGKDTPKVHVNIFQKVILLVSRMSENSQALYVEDPGSSFCSYIDVPISALRSHGDACVLCNIVKEGFKLSERSATIDIAEKWYSRAISRHPVSADALENNKDLENNEKAKKAYFRFLAACRAHSLLNTCNDTNEAYETIVFLIKYSKEQDKDNAYEWLISFLKVLSRPFLSFRKSTREAVFKLLLKLTEEALGRSNDKEIQKMLEVVPSPKKSNFIYFLIKRLSKMGSNYMLRSSVYRVIAEHLPDPKADFIMGAKQIIESSGDETKSMWLESLLINKKEPKEAESDADERKDAVYSTDSIDLDLSIYIENTRIMYEGIQKLYDIKNKPGGDSKFHLKDLEIYYLKYFMDMLKLNRIEPERIPEICGCVVKLHGMLRATHDQSSGASSDSPIKFYERLCSEFKVLSNADRVDMFGNPKKEKGKSAKYLIASSRDENLPDPGKALSFLDTPEGSLKLRSFCINQRDEDKITAYCVFDGIELAGDARRSYEQQSTNLLEENYLPELIDTVIVMLSYPNSGNETMLKIGGFPLNVVFGLRAVLVFRHDLVRRLAVDFQNNMFQMRRVYENFRAQIRKARSWGHTDDRELMQLIHQLADCSEEEDKYRIDTLELLINIYIGRLNIRLLQADVDNNDPDIRKTKTGINLQPFFGFPIFGESKMVDNLLRILHSEKRFKIIYQKEIGNKEYCLPDAVHNWPVRPCGSDNMVPIYIEMLMILLNIINSASKHGAVEEGKCLEIDISTCPDDSHSFYWLEITNRFNSSDVDGFIAHVQKCLLREQDAAGISLAVIYEYMKNAYGKEGIDVSSFVKVDKTEQRFKVRLPVLGMPVKKKDGG